MFVYDTQWRLTTGKGASKELISLMSKATQRLWVISPTLDLSLTRVLQHAHQRGVDVRLITMTDYPLAEHRQVLHTLLKRKQVVINPQYKKTKTRMWLSLILPIPGIFFFLHYKKKLKNFAWWELSSSFPISLLSPQQKQIINVRSVLTDSRYAMTTSLLTQQALTNNYDGLFTCKAQRILKAAAEDFMQLQEHPSLSIRNCEQLQLLHLEKNGIEMRSTPHH